MIVNSNSLYVDKGRSQIFYLGYKLNLSKSEFKIICAIAGSTVEYITAESILRECFTNKDVKPGNVAAHICNINRKAAVIGGRKIILSKYDTGYKLNEDM